CDLCMLYYLVIRVWFLFLLFFFFSSRRRHTRSKRDWSSDVCSSDLLTIQLLCDRRRIWKKTRTESPGTAVPLQLAAAPSLLPSKENHWKSMLQKLALRSRRWQQSKF